MKFKVAKTS